LKKKKKKEKRGGGEGWPLPGGKRKHTTGPNFSEGEKGGPVSHRKGKERKMGEERGGGDPLYLHRRTEIGGKWPAGAKWGGKGAAVPGETTQAISV